LKSAFEWPMRWLISWFRSASQAPTLSAVLFIDRTWDEFSTTFTFLQPLQKLRKETGVFVCFKCALSMLYKEIQLFKKRLPTMIIAFIIDLLLPII
jgi:hypothetical protein